MIDEILTQSDRTLPQLGPVRQVQLFAVAALAGDFLPPILAGRDIVKHLVRIRDARERKPQRTNLQHVIADLIPPSNPRQKARAPPISPF